MKKLLFICLLLIATCSVCEAGSITSRSLFDITDGVATLENSYDMQVDGDLTVGGVMFGDVRIAGGLSLTGDDSTVAAGNDIDFVKYVGNLPHNDSTHEFTLEANVTYAIYYKMYASFTSAGLIAIKPYNVTDGYLYLHQATLFSSTYSVGDVQGSGVIMYIIKPDKETNIEFRVSANSNASKVNQSGTAALIYELYRE